MQRKYRKIVKKALKNGFDFEKLGDMQKKHFEHISPRTSSKLLPPI